MTKITRDWLTAEIQRQIQSIEILTKRLGQLTDVDDIVDAESQIQTARYQRELEILALEALENRELRDQSTIQTDEKTDEKMDLESELN